jgi:hypothetical protein
MCAFVWRPLPGPARRESKFLPQPDPDMLKSVRAWRARAILSRSPIRRTLMPRNEGDVPLGARN